MTVEPAEAPQLEQALRSQHTECVEDSVETGDVVALRREVTVTVAKHLEMEPRDDVERAERRSGVPRAGALDHVERVQPAGVREARSPRHRVGVERADPLELGIRDVAQAHDCEPSVARALRALTGVL